MIPNILQRGQDLQILQISLGDLLAFRIVIKIVKTKHASLAGQAKIRIVARHVDFVLELDASQRYSGGIELVHELLEINPGQAGVQR